MTNRARLCSSLCLALSFLASCKSQSRKPLDEKPWVSAPAPSAREAAVPPPQVGPVYLPLCSHQGLEAGGYKLAFAGAKAEQGYMRRIAGNGFSCKLNPDSDGDNTLPTCAQACPEQKNVFEGEWGWCEGSLGFACLN